MVYVFMDALFEEIVNKFVKSGLVPQTETIKSKNYVKIQASANFVHIIVNVSRLHM